MRINRGAFRYVRLLGRQHADLPTAASWHSLPSLVDQVAASVAKIDEAYFVLEDMHAKVHPSGLCGTASNFLLVRCCTCSQLDVWTSQTSKELWRHVI